MSGHGGCRDAVGIVVGLGVAIATWQISRHGEYRGAVAGYHRTDGVMVPWPGVTT